MAIDELATRGFDQFSMRRLAGRLDFTPTTLYYYWRDRQDLLEAVRRHLVLQLDDDIVAVLDTQVHESPVLALCTLCHAMLDWFSAHPAEATLIMGGLPPRLDATPADMSLYYRTFNRARDLIAACVDSAYFKPVDPELVASVGTSLLWGVWTHVRTMRVSTAYFGREQEVFSHAIEMLINSYRIESQ